MSNSPKMVVSPSADQPRKRKNTRTKLMSPTESAASARSAGTISVPSGIKPSDIKASMEHGLLKVILPTEPKEPATAQITIA
jgi:HSP20 family molecular chaperone IbpA